MTTAINTFRNVRARMCRTESDESMTGWVIDLARVHARIRLVNPVQFVAGERMQCECFGQGTVARFLGEVVGQSDAQVILAIVGSIAFLPSNEPPRIQATGVFGEIRGEFQTATCRILDLSPQSFGAVVDGEFTPGEPLSMTLSTELGTIEADLSIANIRPHRSRPGSFRAGFHIVDMSRLDRVRWSRLLAEKAGG